MLECALEADQQLWIAADHAVGVPDRLLRDRPCPAVPRSGDRGGAKPDRAVRGDRRSRRPGRTAFRPAGTGAADGGRSRGRRALPLLAFTLQELYLDAGKSRVVTGADYRRMHGVTGALTRQADRVTAELRFGDPDSPVLATLLGSSPSPMARPPAGGCGPAPLILASAGSRTRSCLPACWSHRPAPTTANAVLDVAHEALFQHWAPLRQEIEAHAEELQRRTDLERWAADWERSGRRTPICCALTGSARPASSLANPARIQIVPGHRVRRPLDPRRPSPGSGFRDDRQAGHGRDRRRP